MLNNIRLSGEILKGGGTLQEAQSVSIARILRGVRSIDRLMNDLSVLVRSRMRIQLPLTKTDADLGAICEQTLEEVKASHRNTVCSVGFVPTGTRYSTGEPAGADQANRSSARGVGVRPF